MLKKKMITTMLGYVLAGCLTFGSVVAAFGETPPAGVQIKEFSLQDTASDIVGAADFTPEGNKDGHFKLSLNLAQKTVINAVVLRSTDAYGKDNYQGVWRTNRVTTGWLLGIMQGSNVINPGFRKDVKEPVGTFEGTLNWDLYASNNGTIKETQYYVLEIETSQGTLASQPVKYQKSQGGNTTPTPTPAPTPSTPTPTPMPVPTPSTPTQTPTPNPGPTTTPVSINPLTVKGGAGSVSVENGTPGSTMTLMLKEPNRTLTSGMYLFSVENGGKGTIYGVPAGKDYYVFNAAGKPFGPITVTEPENSELFNLSKTTVAATLDPSTKMYTIKVSGEVQDSVKQVRAKGYAEIIPVTDNKFSATFSADPVRNPTRELLIAETEDGKKASVYVEMQHDFVNDTTVEATKQDGDGSWLIKGNYAVDKNKEGLDTFLWNGITGELTYLQDRRLVGKAAPRSKEEADLKQSMTDFEYQIAPPKDRFDLTFFVINRQGEFELVKPMEGLGTWSILKPRKDIYLYVGSTRAIVNDKVNTLEVAPFFQQNRSMVPLRFIAEAMGVTVGWNGEDQSVTLTKEDTQIKLQIGRYEAYINGQEHRMDTVPIIKDGVTIVPLRFVSESLNMDVQFDEGIIHITNKK